MTSIDITSGGMIALPSRQSLYIRMKFNDTQLASGTAFLVASYTGVALVTARHNFTGRDHNTDACLHSQGGTPNRLEIFHNAQPSGEWRNELRTEDLLDENGDPLWIEHPKLGASCDIAMLRLRNCSDIILVPYTWESQYPRISIRVTEVVSVVGFPMAQTGGGMMPIWCSGYIASEPTENYAGQPKFLVDCRTRQGQSGSPVIAYRNGPYSSENAALNVGGPAATRPLGVYTGRIHPEADIGVVWKWSVVEDLMREFDFQTSQLIRASQQKYGDDSPEFETELAKLGLARTW